MFGRSHWFWFLSIAMIALSANSAIAQQFFRTIRIEKTFSFSSQVFDDPGTINVIKSAVRQHPESNPLWEPAYQRRWQFFNPIELPVNSCSNTSRFQFIITGRGGIPANPSDLLTSDAVLVDWVTLKPNSDNRSTPSVSTQTNPTPEPIVEATGWVRNSKGEVELTANAATTPHKPWQKKPSCRAS